MGEGAVRAPPQPGPRPGDRVRETKAPETDRQNRGQNGDHARREGTHPPQGPNTTSKAVRVAA